MKNVVRVIVQKDHDLWLPRIFKIVSNENVSRIYLLQSPTGVLESPLFIGMAYNPLPWGELIQSYLIADVAVSFILRPENFLIYDYEDFRAKYYADGFQYFLAQN